MPKAYPIDMNITRSKKFKCEQTAADVEQTAATFCSLISCTGELPYQRRKLYRGWQQELAKDSNSDVNKHIRTKLRVAPYSGQCAGVKTCAEVGLP